MYIQKKKILSLFLVSFVLWIVSCEDRAPTLSTAAIMARQHVNKMVSFPEEVDYEFGSHRGSGDAMNGFTVYETFTAPNAFGMKRKYVYKCKMKYLGGDKYEDSSWECSNLIIEDVQTGEQWKSYDY